MLLLISLSKSVYHEKRSPLVKIKKKKKSLLSVFILSLNSRDYRFMLTNHLSEADVEPLPVEPSPDHHFSTLPAPALSSSGLIPSDRG